MTRLLRAKLYGHYSLNFSARGESAGLGIEFDHSQTPGIHFEVEPPDEYRSAIIRGIEEGMTARFPDFLTTRSISITEITAHEVDSSQRAFYRAGRMVIEQAFALTQNTNGT